jgi:S-adenosylmethionine:tRNA ribosyltransferase-isomerase
VGSIPTLGTSHSFMKLSDFDFSLPENLIAQNPPEIRGNSRLMVCSKTQKILHQNFSAIEALIQANDVLVINNTKVLKARLHGKKASGGKIEVMLERILDDKRFTAMIRASKAPKEGSDILIAGQHRAQVIAKHGMMYELRLAPDTLELDQILDQHGQLPLPPYITHTATTQDEQRYQTVFAQEPGAVAAPTAGLHFTDELLARIKQRGTRILNLTLHVGAGTFLPVKSDDVENHVMHSERFSIQAEVIAALLQTKAQGGRIIAVGTTSLRALEAWASETQCNLNTPEGLEQAQLYTQTGYSGDTQIFIKPGYTFKVVDRLITNFHLPKSTLLMLVSAFAGQAHIFHAYQEAIEQGYRFFSYGDAMWLEKA